MTDLDFEYAIRKDVRNNPIVRELDRARHREMWSWAAIGALLLLVVLFSSLQHFKLIRYGYDIEKMQKRRAEQERLNRHLRLELETLRSPERIASLATSELKLVAPAPADSVIIGRVAASEPPARGLVASR
jgi:cell division protein FtsL